MFIIQIYVDDIIIGSTNEDLCEDFANIMKSEFEMSLIRKLNFFLCLQIKKTRDGTLLHQERYAKELVKKFGLEGCKKVETSMSYTIKLDKDEKDKLVHSKMYRSMIGLLLYLTTSKPDLLFGTCLCACI